LFTYVVRFLFFFQAEDGIRDFHVTGVQTCALPILLTSRLTWPLVPVSMVQSRPSASSGMEPRTRIRSSSVPLYSKSLQAVPSTRSEERRVGKECRSRCAAQH